jgi:ribosome-associated protein
VSERGVRIGPGQSIPLAEIELRASRSSGPGGQHANVTASRIEAVFEIEPSASLTAEQKARLAHRYGKRITAIAQDARSQARNRDLALRRLRERLADGLRVAPARRPTRPTRASVNRRLDAKRRQAARKAERRRPATD